MRVSQSSTFGFSWFCGGVLTPRWQAVAISACFALTATVGVAVEPQQAVAAPAASKVNPGLQSAAPDVVSASVTARAQGARVEVEGLRSETSTSWVNPDGTVTTEQHAGQVRFRGGDGSWQDVDLSMADRVDGSSGAKGHRLGLSVAGKSSAAGKGARGSSGTDLVAVDEPPGKDRTARQVVLGWPGALPAPQLKDNRATYLDATLGVDVVVESRRSGFEQLTVVKDRAALESLTSADGSLVVSLPVKTKGLTGRVEADRSVSFVDAKGEVVSRFTAPLAWDAVVDPRSGDHPNVTSVKVSLAQKGKGKAVLSLAVDPAWASDPARVFPITIDPTYATGSNVTTSFDTYVQKDKTWDTSAETELRVGTSDGGSSIVARSFLNFANSFTGKDIKSASLSINETWSYSCTAKTVTAYKSGTASTSTRWSAQPSVTTSASGSLSVAKGYSSSCPDARISIPVTNIADAWSATSATTVALRLSASETDSYGWKKFASRETSTDPYITYTYNRKPNAGSAPTVTPGYSYTPPGGTAAVYTSALKPTLKATATDPDGNMVLFKIEVHSSKSGSALVTSCTTALVASGSTGSCTLATNLTNNTEYYARTAVQDDQGLWNGTWSPWTTFRVGTTKPNAPTITCSPYSNGDTLADVPTAPISCTVTAPGASWSAPSSIKVSKDGGAAASVAITPSSSASVAKAPVSIANTKGTRTLSITAVSPAQIASDATTFTVILGGPTLTAPANGVTSTGTVPVRTTLPRPAGTLAGHLQYRLAGSATGGWTDDTTLVVTDDPVPPGSTVTVTAKGSWDLAGVEGANISDRVPVTFEARACITTTSDTSTCVATTAASTVTRLPNAFGGGYPVDNSSGVGSVAQFTGELATSAADVSVGSLGVGRSYASFSGDQTTEDPVPRIFGPGWTGEFGTVSGRAASVVRDATFADGTMSISESGGASILTFARTPAGRDYPAGTETYAPVNTAATESETALSFSRSGTAGVLTLTESDGVATTWTATLPSGAPTAAVVWTPSSVTDPGDVTAAHTYLYPDGAGRVGRIVDVPVGRSSTDCPNTAAWAVDATHNPRGCSALDITYGTATAPDAPNQVKAITARIWNPVTSAVDTFAVSAYEYDTSGRLVAVTDSRTALTTRYGWDGISTRLSTITPPGQAPYRVYYDGSGRVKLITRDSATATAWTTTTLTTPPTGSVALVRYLYGVTPGGNGTAQPDLSTAATAHWNQVDVASPTTGFAVLGPDYPWDGTTTVTAPAETSTSWQYADLSFTTSDGYTVNTAAFGAGQWLTSATMYDTQGRDVWSLSPAAIHDIITSPVVEDEAVVDAMATETRYSEDGLITDVLEPVRDVSIGDSQLQSMRRHTRYTYDEGAPNSGVNPETDQPYGLVTTVTTAAAYPDGQDATTTGVTTFGYGPLGTGDTSGWDLGAATTTTQVDVAHNGAGNITRATRYDPSGRVIETRQPSATSTGDAGTTITDYYSGTGAESTACQGKPEWDGLVCRTRPGADPTGGTNLPELPTKWYTYDQWGAATITEKTSSGTTLRTTVATSDTAGRPLTVAVTSTVAGSTSRPGQTFDYAAATGLPLSVTTTGTTTETLTGYDGWARPSGYTNSLGETTTTSYGTNGQVSTITDPTGTQTFTWDGTDADGNIERRGLPTALTVTRGGTGGNLTYTAAYDATGNLILQAMPGALRLRNTYDQIGQLTEQTYTGQVTPVTEEQDSDGNTIWTPGAPEQDQAWLTWSRRYDIDGRVALEWNGAGAAFDGVPGVSDPTDITAPTVGRALAADKGFAYDFAGRLTDVTDRSATNTGDTLEPGTDIRPDAPCVARRYTFDTNGNRTGLTEKTNTDGDCTGNPTPTTQTYDYDTADRPIHGANTTGTYTYDTLSRQTALPSADAPIQNAGDITIGYYDDDLARTMTQRDTSTSYALDPESRRLDETVTTASATTITRRHYGDTSDNPAWITTTQGATSTVTRYLSTLSPSVSTSLASDGSGSSILTDPHGDTVTSVPLSASVTSSAPAEAISGWSAYDEYGRTPELAAAGTLGYGYLGSAERSTTSGSLGLTLMGVRLYNATRSLFTSVDPIPAGNEAAYTYPADPLNDSDPTGKCRTSWGCSHKSFLSSAASLLERIGGWLGWCWFTACAVVSTFLYLFAAAARFLLSQDRAATSDLINAVGAYIGGKYLKHFIHAYIGSHLSEMARVYAKIGRALSYIGASGFYSRIVSIMSNIAYVI